MPRSKRMSLPEYVTEVVSAGSGVLVAQAGMTPERARELMFEVVEAVCFRHAKSTVYVPEAVQLVNIKRNAKIWCEYQLDGAEPPYVKKYTPARALELAAKYDLSPQQMYNILRGEREQEVAERQREIPGIDPTS